MKRAAIVVLLICSTAWAQNPATKHPTTGPSTKPAGDLTTEYDRFKDRTYVTLLVHDELGFIIGYDGRERTDWFTSAVLLGGQRRLLTPSEVIFLADGKRVSIKPEGDRFGGERSMVIGFDLLEDLAKAKLLEAAVIYPEARAEVTFDAGDMDGLHRFIEASGYDSPEALASRHHSEEVAGGRLRLLRPITAPEGDVAYILDGSGSMLTVFQDAKLVVEQSIETLGMRQTFKIVIDSDIAPPQFSARPATEDNKKKALEFVAGLRAGGSGADIEKVFKAAVESHPKSIVYISDFDVGWDAAKTAAFLQQVRASSIPIQVLLMGGFHAPGQRGSECRPLAMKIAEKSGGAAFGVDEDLVFDRDQDRLIAPNFPGLERISNGAAQVKPLPDH